MTYARNTLRRLSEGEAFPDVVVNWLAKQIDDVLVATGTVGGTNVLLGEHSGLLIRLITLLRDKHIIKTLNLNSRIEVK